jgi:hypothetical protein
MAKKTQTATSFIKPPRKKGKAKKKKNKHESKKRSVGQGK